MKHTKKNEDKNKQEKKEHRDRFVSNILLVSVLIFLIYSLFLTGVVKITPNGSTANNKDTIEEIEEVEDRKKLKLTDSIVNNLYKSIELGRNYNALRHYYFYSYDKVFARYMDEAFIKEMALSRLVLTDSNSFSASILEDKYKDIVGNNTTYKNRTFQTQCSTVKYNSTLNNYTVYTDSNCKTTRDGNDDYFDKIIEAYKYSDRIEIITRVGYYEEEKELVDEGIYQNTGKIIIKRNMDTDEVIGTFSEGIEQIKKTIDYSKLAKYKYTFRLDNNKYYFYSVEIDE